MVTRNEVQRRLIALRKAHAVLTRHHIVEPTVDDRRWAIEHTGSQLREPFHEERWSHEEQAASVQERRGCNGDIAPEARAHENQIARQLLAKLDQLGNPGAGLVDPPVVDRVRLVPLAPRYFGEGSDLATPRSTLLAVRKHDMAAHDRRFHKSSSRSRAGSLTTRPRMSWTPSARKRRRCSANCRDEAGKAMRPPARTTRCHGTSRSRGAILSARPTSRARPGSPARRATAP